MTGVHGNTGQRHSTTKNNAINLSHSIYVEYV